MKLVVNIEKRLRDFTLAANFTLTDTTLALLGASGSGKSMTLKCIAGLERPDRGQIVLNERILFDRFSAQADGIPSQQMLVHAILSFDAREAQYIDENAELFDRLGFHLEPAGEREYRLTEAPADIPLDEAEDTIREVLVSLGDLHAVLRRAVAPRAYHIARAARDVGDTHELSLKLFKRQLDRFFAPRNVHAEADGAVCQIVGRRDLIEHLYDFFLFLHGLSLFVCFDFAQRSFQRAQKSLFFI